jgi:hypothetical protein
MLGPWLTTGDVAKTLGVHVQTVRRWVRRGRLQSRRNPANWSLFHPDDVAAMVLPAQQPRVSQVWDRGCSEDGCTGSHHAHGRCKAHDQQQRRVERGAGVRPVRRFDLEDSGEL